MTDKPSEPLTAANGRALISGAEPKEPILITQAGIQLTSVEQVWRMATLLHQSQLVPASFKTPQQLVVALLRAIELGLPPLQALEGMSVINNKVGLMGDLALSMVESSGRLESKRVEYIGEGDALECKVTLQRKGREAQTYSFSVREARAAGIYDRSPTWRNYPRRMTYYRALGFGLRDEFADVLKGTKTVEELQDYPIEEELRRGQPKIVQSAKESAQQVVHDSEVTAPTDEDKKPPSPDSMAPKNGSSPLAKVRLRLKASQILESEFLDVLKFSKLPEAQDFADLAQVPERLLIMALEGWSTVAEIVHELRGRKAEAKS